MGNKELKLEDINDLINDGTKLHNPEKAAETQKEAREKAEREGKSIGRTIADKAINKDGQDIDDIENEEPTL